jgi:regulator of protease activity HflC (stomatin/prohibitin superfamily)
VDREGLGLEVTFVGIPAVHPPKETASAFENVVAAMEQKESLIYQGETESAKMVQGALGDSAEQVNEAEGTAQQMVKNAVASKNQFAVQLDVYQRAPLVYQFRRYFDTIEQVLKGQKLYVVPKSNDEVVIIDTKEKLTPELLKLNPGGE